MFLISTETGNVADLVLKNKSIDVKNIPPSASIKNDSANGSPQPLSSPPSISTSLLTLSGISITLKSKGGSCLGGNTGGKTGGGVSILKGIGGGGGKIGGGTGGGLSGGGVNIGNSGNGGGGGGNTGGGGATGGGGGNEPSPVTFSLSPLLVIVLSPFSLSNTTRPFLVDTTSVCELFNRPCA